MNSWTRQRLFLLIAILIISAYRITSGEWAIPLPEVIHYLSPYLPDSEAVSPKGIIIRSVRLPRVLCAVGTGGLLAVSGAVFQGLLANPLAEPYTLGVASGAAFGAAAGIMAGTFAVMPCAFAGAMAALALTGLIAFRGGSERVILAGVISNALLSAGVTFLKAAAGDKLSAVVLWMMGSLAGAGPSDAVSVWLGAVGVSVCSYAFGSVLDAMSLGRDYAAALGVNESRVRISLAAVTSLCVSVCVSSFGVIGFVGLVVPHVARSLVGAVHRRVVVHSFLIGGLVLSAADCAAQMMGELPVGVITALIGGPFFCRVLMKRQP